jgi:hypothetical protein
MIASTTADDKYLHALPRNTIVKKAYANVSQEALALGNGKRKDPYLCMIPPHATSQ